MLVQYAEDIAEIFLFPIDSQEMRHLFAVIAKGEENTRNWILFRHSTDKSKLQQDCQHIELPEPDHPHMHRKRNRCGSGHPKFKLHQCIAEECNTAKHSSVV